MQALLDAAAVADYPVDVVALVSDQPDAGALGRAEAMGIATAVVQPSAHPDRAAWDEALRATIASFAPDWVVSAGFMRLLGPSVLDAFPGRIVNTHPALLPSFPGVRGVADALDYGVRVTGCTVHLADNEYDHGPIILQRVVGVLDEDTPESLAFRVQAAERERIGHCIGYVQFAADIWNVVEIAFGVGGDEVARRRREAVA